MKPLATLLLALAPAFGQPPELAPPPTPVSSPPAGPRIRIGLINYGHIFTKYEKAADFKKELEELLDPLKKRAEQIKLEMKAYQGVIENKAQNNPEEVIADAQQQMRDRQRQLEDLDTQARRLIGKRQEQQLIDLWVDIKNAVADYAREKDFDLVLAYGDPPDINPDTFTNINRKMSGMDIGNAVPVFIRNGAEISADVLNRLNENHRSQRKPLAKATKSSP